MWDSFFFGYVKIWSYKKEEQYYGNLKLYRCVSHPAYLTLQINLNIFVIRLLKKAPHLEIFVLLNWEYLTVLWYINEKIPCSLCVVVLYFYQTMKRQWWRAAAYNNISPRRQKSSIQYMWKVLIYWDMSKKLITECTWYKHRHFKYTKWSGKQLWDMLQTLRKDSNLSR